MAKRPKYRKERPPDPHSLAAMWRMFIAIPLAPEAKQFVAGIIDDLARHDWPVRWVTPETAHLTLHFLGDTPPEQVELLRLGLGQVALRHRAFSLATSGLGVFPDLRRPRVLWLGLSGETDALGALHRDVGQALRSLGFEVEAGRLNPHLTLGRLRDAPEPATQREIERLFREGSSLDAQVAIPATEFQLIRSFLGKGPPRHEPLARYPLSG